MMTLSYSDDKKSIFTQFEAEDLDLLQCFYHIMRMSGIDHSEIKEKMIAFIDDREGKTVSKPLNS